jgi:hypothetical protein
MPWLAARTLWQANPAAVAASICQTLKAPVQPHLWSDYLTRIPYAPVCGQGRSGQ